MFADQSATADFTDNTPDIGSANLSSASISEVTGTAFLSGGNIYAFGGGVNPGIFTLSVAGNGSGPVVGDNATVYLQITTRGTTVDTSSVKLSGLNAESTTLISSIGLGGFGGAEDTWLFSWNTVGVTNWDFDFQATGPHLSLAALAVDIQTSQVPVPAAAWLMGSGLVGLSAIARRRKA